MLPWLIREPIDTSLDQCQAILPIENGEDLLQTRGYKISFMNTANVQVDDRLHTTSLITRKTDLHSCDYTGMNA
jgi:hypothetical protein